MQGEYQVQYLRKRATLSITCVRSGEGSSNQSRQHPATWTLWSCIGSPNCRQNSEGVRHGNIRGVVLHWFQKVVLGYIRNKGRKLYVYVANRVEITRKFSTPDQWMYVENCNHPADLATRGLQAKNLTESINGLEFLRKVTVDALILDADQVTSTQTIRRCARR